MNAFMNWITALQKAPFEFQRLSNYFKFSPRAFNQLIHCTVMVVYYQIASCSKSTHADVRIVISGVTSSYINEMASARGEEGPVQVQSSPMDGPSPPTESAGPLDLKLACTVASLPLPQTRLCPNFEADRQAGH